MCQRAPFQLSPSRSRRAERLPRAPTFSQAQTSWIASSVQRVPAIPKARGSRRTTWRRASLAASGPANRGGKRGLAPPPRADRQAGEAAALVAIQPGVDAVRVARPQQAGARHPGRRDARGDLEDRRGPLAQVRLRGGVAQPLQGAPLVGAQTDRALAHPDLRANYPGEVPHVSYRSKLLRFIKAERPG